MLTRSQFPASRCVFVCELQPGQSYLYESIMTLRMQRHKLISSVNNTSKISATSFPPCSNLITTVIHVMPFKQVVQVSMPAMPEPLMDLVLSGMAYSALMQALSLAVGTIALVLFPADWILHKISVISDWRNEIIWWMFLSLWAARFTLRWRGHLACAWGCFACILRWLSPLSPKPFEACLFCRKSIQEEHSSGKGCQHDQKDQPQPPHPTLPPPCPTSPAKTQDEKPFADDIRNKVTLPLPPPLPTSPVKAQDQKRFADDIGKKVARLKLSLTDDERRAQREIGIFC